MLPNNHVSLDIMIVLLYNSSIPLLHVQDEETYLTTMGNEVSKKSKTQPYFVKIRMFQNRIHHDTK